MSNLIDKLIYSPPGWVAAVLTALLCSHAIHLALRFITEHHRGPNGLIIIIELFILVVLGYLTLHLFLHFGTENPTGNKVEHAESPYLMLLALMIFGLLSAILYTELKLRLQQIAKASPPGATEPVKLPSRRKGKKS